MYSQMINISDTLQQQDQKQSQQYLTIIKSLLHRQSINYWIGNPSVQIIFGELYLKKYNQPKQTTTLEQYIKQFKELNSMESSCLAVIGIPNCIRPIELWESLTDTKQYIEQCKVIKTQQPGYYSLLIKLKSEENCQEFYRLNFGRKINELQNYLILFRQIENITIQFDELVKQERIQLQIYKRKKTQQIHLISPENIFMSYTINKSTEAVSLICAICFQDIVDSNQDQSILSILCGHYFHENCLFKWNQPTCPLCRYHQQPPTLSFCQLCNNNENLWLCLVCGKKLCSGNEEILQSANSHIYQHYKQTGHTIAMETETKFIYEFELKDFLHRVYFNEKTNQPVAGVESKSKSKSKKSKDIIKEYQNVTMIEMENQRKYFEKKMSEDKKTQKQTLQNLTSQINYYKQQNDKLEVRFREWQQKQEKEQTIQQLDSQLKTSQKYYKLLVSKLKSMDNKVSKINQKEQHEIEKLNEQIQDKRLEIKDIQQNIKANKNIKKKLNGQKISMEYFVKK